MKIASIGIDIDKTTFHPVALDEHGSIVIRRKFSRKALLVYTAKLANSLIGMEGGAHCLARLLRDQGHQVRLYPAYVRRFSPALMMIRRVPVL
jgi:transposase